MVLTKNILWIGGVNEDSSKELLDTLAGKNGSTVCGLHVVSGEKIAEYHFDHAITWDGMAAAREKLFLSMKNGSLVCMEPAKLQASHSR